MRQERKHIVFLYLFIIFFALLFILIFFVDPKSIFEAGNFYVPPLYIFLPLLFLTIFSLFSFILLSKRRAALLSIFVVSLLILRFFGFRSPFYLLLLSSIILLSEFFLADRPRQKKSRLLHKLES
ncbi:MAG: hypothetical protein COX79_05170 [Candidatus Levybacteria bacterium CG_4_10_14_0_2_um_filter_36_16]|nr:MAG: hypothetical protein AUK12_00980 [Candidatus Levybacteria bacterium CG2_30_37_29]PIR79346.1 MAG: hypothetical protein COU26_01555 [Candidatus Levybacteria bacterium CG10_big_fil_rev_8_21_14_0_10_36_30]PIZ96447.1 MAG: hypothetical protein COX79_05170 [Candidatus Levybacteria bacterium CG_4_10_14_0_2_um_filter_36_16]